MSKIGAFQKEINFLNSIIQKELTRNLEREILWGITAKSFVLDDLKENEIWIDIGSYMTNMILNPSPICYKYKDLLRLK